MLFLIREVLIVNWGKEEHRASLFAAKPQLAAKNGNGVKNGNGKKHA